MNSKERVKSAINHHETDRIPVSIAGLNLAIEKRLKQYLNIKADDNERLLNALNIDTRTIRIPPYQGVQLFQNIPGEVVDPLWGIRRKWVENTSGGYWDYCDFPLRNATEEVVASWPMPSIDDFDYDLIAEFCEQNKNYGVIFGSPGWVDIINSTGMLRSMEQVLIDLAMDEPAGLLYIKRKTEIQLGIMQRVLEKVGRKIDLIWIGEDLGTQNSPIISIEMFRKYLRPVHQKFVDLANNYDIPVMIHSCGSSSWAFNDFIDMGIKVVDTLQPEARDMSPAYLKANYGNKLCFHGCISTAGPLAYGTVKEIEKNVRDTIEIMGTKGGYIMAPTHMIQDNTPAENIVAAYKTALRITN